MLWRSSARGAVVECAKRNLTIRLCFIDLIYTVQKIFCVNLKRTITKIPDFLRGSLVFTLAPATVIPLCTKYLYAFVVPNVCNCCIWILVLAFVNGFRRNQFVIPEVSVEINVYRFNPPSHVALQQTVLKWKFLVHVPLMFNFMCIFTVEHAHPVCARHCSPL